MIFNKQKKIVPKELFVLSCQGTGTRAYITALILKEVETECRAQGLSKKLSSYLDIYSAVSTGSLVLALLLMDSYSIQDIVDFIRNDLKNFLQINEERRTSFILGKKVQYTYSNECLLSHLRGIFGNISLGFFNKDIIFPLYDILNFNVFEVNNRFDPQLELYKVLMASMATPHYFSPVHFKGTHVNTKTDARLLDGSILCMHPALSAYTHAIKHYEHIKDITILSIGDGMIPVSSLNKSGYPGWVDIDTANPMLQLLENTRLKNDELLLSQLPHVKKIGINGYLKDYYTHNLYDCSEKYFDYLEENAIDIIHKNRLEIKQFVSKIKAREQA